MNAKDLANLRELAQDTVKLYERCALNGARADELLSAQTILALLDEIKRLHDGIREALNYANQRWEEWGMRAQEVENILESTIRARGASPAASELRAAVDWAEAHHPLPRCEHGKALRDASSERLAPDCGCRAVLPAEQIPMPAPGECCDECGYLPAKGNVVYEDSGRRPLCRSCIAAMKEQP